MLFSVSSHEQPRLRDLCLSPFLKRYQKTIERDSGGEFDILLQSLAEACEDKGNEGWGGDFYDVLRFHRN